MIVDIVDCKELIAEAYSRGDFRHNPTMTDSNLGDFFYLCVNKGDIISVLNSDELYINLHHVRVSKAVLEDVFKSQIKKDRIRFKNEFEYHTLKNAFCKFLMPQVDESLEGHKIVFYMDCITARSS